MNDAAFTDLPAPTRGRRPAWPAGIGLGVAVAVLVSLLHAGGFFNPLESRLYDQRARWLAARVTPSPEILIVAVDDRSLELLQPELGRWPWPRSIFAEVIDYCSRAHTVVMDIIFPEADAARPEADAGLVRAMRQHGGVISAVFLDDLPRRPAVPPAMKGRALAEAGWAGLRLLHHDSALAPFPDLLEASADFGFINYQADPDGVHRAYALAARVGGQVYPSLALAAARHYRPERGDGIQLGPGRFAHVAGRRIPLDAEGRFAWVPAGKPYTTYSLVDVLRSARNEKSGREFSVPRQVFQDKIVFIGSTATGLQGDRHITPLSVYTPGVQVMAGATDNLLNGTCFGKPGRSAQALLILLMAVIPSLRASDRPARLLLTLAGLALGYAGAAGLLLWFYRLMCPLTAPGLALGLTGAGLGTLRWTRERKHRKRLEQLETAKQKFTDMLVHDLRSQLAPVVMSLSLLEEKTREGADPRLAALIGTSRNCVRRLVAQVSSLLDIRKIEEGRLVLNREPESADGLVRRALEEYRPAAEKAGIGIVQSAALDPSVLIQVDADIFSRVLGNLVWNSIKYAATASVIEVTGERAPGGAVAISVANRGPVISSSQQDQLFQPFTTLSTRSPNIDVSGTGLGLAFCKLAVEAHGGSIQLESPWRKTGDGVKITVTIPAGV